MSDVGAPWLATMRELAGVKEYAGGENNPAIVGWASFIGNRYPEMANYAAAYKHDSIPWCGLTAAFCLSKNGVRPPFGDEDVERFLWANAFAGSYGIRLNTWRQGSIAVFKWRTGGGHVGFVDRVDGNTVYIIGGNQSDAVTVAPFRIDDQLVGFFWPPAVAAASAERTPAAVRRRMGQAITAAEARRDAQGHLAVYWLPANDGGGAYEVAGINVRYHPAAAAQLKSLIEAGRHQEAEDFVGDYTATYTDVADAWTVSWGVEFYLRDCVFNRGPTGAAKILQRALILRGESLGPDGVDGDVGPITMDAMRRQEVDVDAVLTALRQAREDYEREDVGYRANFWNGLINRFNNALTVARRFDGEQPKEPQVSTDPASPPAVASEFVKEIQGLRSDIASLTAGIGAILSALRGGATAAPGTVEPTKPVEPAPAPAPTPPASTPLLDRPGVGLGIASGGLALIMQLLGIPVAGEGATVATSAPLITAIGSGALGLSGWGGIITSALGTVLQMVVNRNAKK